MSMHTVKKDSWNRLCRLLTFPKHSTVPMRQFKDSSASLCTATSKRPAL
jgi:hypothetical protein